MSQKKWFFFIILLFIAPASLSCSLPFVPVEAQPDGYLVWKELVILLFECVVGEYFVVFYVFSFPAGVYVGTLNLIASIPDPHILTIHIYNHNIQSSFLKPLGQSKSKLIGSICMEAESI